MQHSYRWRSHPNVSQLERNLDELRTTVIRLRHEVANKTGYVGKLEVLLRERLARIDALNGKIEQLRDQNRRLDEENEHLVEMVRLSPDLILERSSPGEST